MEKQKAKKITNIIEWIVIGIFGVFFLFVIVFASKSPTGNSSGSVFGFETRLVLSSSMEADKDFYKGKDYKIKSIEAGSVVFIKDCNYQNEAKKEKFYASLEAGDVVTYFSKVTNVYVTHRIVEVQKTESDIIYTILGDNVYAETSITEKVNKNDNLIVGEVIGKSKSLGWIYTNVFSNKIAMFFIIAVPCFVLAAYEGVKIVTIVKAEKKEKAALEAKEREDEIVNLQKQIEELKNKKGGE